MTGIAPQHLMDADPAVLDAMAEHHGAVLKEMARAAKGRR